jgi:outer membrane protein assembly factor BamB
MRKFGIFALLSLALIGACSKTDPILPGDREPVFPGSVLTVTGRPVPNLPENAPENKAVDCPYTQDSSNTVWSGNKKIFSGYPTGNSVKSNPTPVCGGGYVFAGLTTGELVKINAKTKNIEWIADIYRTSNLTGGASVLDIVAPAVIVGGHVYAGGLGGAFCKLRAANGAKLWCVDIGVSAPFLVIGRAAFVVGANNTMYAIDTENGDIYWSAAVRSQSAPVYTNKILTVGKEKFDAETGKPVHF